MTDSASKAKPNANLLKPDYRVVSVLEIDLEALKAQGIKGFIFDLDDTLVHALEALAAREVLDWLEEVRCQFQIYIVSNNSSHERVNIAAQHMSCSWVARAAKPSRRFFRKALAEMQLSPREIAIVGDQLFTDVLGGNRLGATTILVDPISAERKWHRKIMRGLERRMLKSHAYHPPRVRHASVGEGVPLHPEPSAQPRAHHPAMEPGAPHHGS